ncbi:MAG: tyrosine-type recombinase/integrase [Chloroflexi bacterium]|nr:tyrosine-type recombinase/integrase [Chloroflexota bacterium]
MPERVGRLYGEGYTETTNPPTNLVSFRARPYLMYLAVRGYARFDLEWIFAIPVLRVWKLLDYLNMDLGVPALVEEAVRLGYERCVPVQELRYVTSRIFLHTGITQAKGITDEHVAEYLEAVHKLGERPDIARYFGTEKRYHQAVEVYTYSLHILNVVLYHRGQVSKEPRKAQPRGIAPPAWAHRPRMKAVIDRYIRERRLVDRPATIDSAELALNLFIRWLMSTHPETESFAQVTREHLLEFAEDLNSMVGVRSKRPYSLSAKIGILSSLNVFFRRVSEWSKWEGQGREGKHQMEVPNRPLLSRGDLPKRAIYLPRYIPDDELERIMEVIRTIDCPFQRAALLIARWSGARRDEICRLSIDCLDSYPDGTSRLRIPAGKTNRERMVPLHEEAAEAIRYILSIRPKVGRGLRDPRTGVETHYLFMHYGKRFSAPYLFEQPLHKACKIAGLITPDGRAKVTAHRFRHTVATQLARKGAKLNTIMRVLGHESANHTMVYLHISDQEVLDDYSAALRTELQPGTPVAGPFAEILRTSRVSSSDVAWLKAKFIKTELELGECLRLPEEGPCECDLYLYCSRFITSPERAPRLRERLRIELTLAEEAQAAGNEKEAERHRHYALRFERYLLNMGEPLETLQLPQGD